MLGQQGWLGLDGSVDGENYGVHCQDLVPARSPSGLDIRQVTYFLKLSFLICKMGSVCLGMGAPLLTSLLYSLLGRGCLWSVLYSDWGEAGMLALLCPKGFENGSPGPTLCVVTFLVLVST